jgi:lambda family phage minor tail protein L
MPTTISNGATVEKNAPATTSAFILFMRITLSDATEIRICRNNEDLTWAGDVYTAFPVEIDDLNEAKGERPQITIRVSNITRALAPYMIDNNGFAGCSVEIMVLNSAHLDEAEPECLFDFVCLSSSTDSRWASFTLGMADIFRKKFPPGTVRKNLCLFAFKGTKCGYSGAYPTCDHTLTQCRARGNSPRFGGFPGVGSKGLIV